MRGQNLSSAYRTSKKRWTKRPPSSSKTARAAWDCHSNKGLIVWMQLLDGFWGAMREDGHIDEIDGF
jgi:hypothetical protein